MNAFNNINYYTISIDSLLIYIKKNCKIISNVNNFLGRLAHLVEFCLHMAEVTGSNPVSPIFVIYPIAISYNLDNNSNA